MLTRCRSGPTRLSVSRIRCMSSLPRAGLLAWLEKHPCPGPTLGSGDGETAVPRRDCTVTVRGREFHPSHTLVLSRQVGQGYWMCSVCGGTASTAVKKLAFHCEGVAGVEGRRAMRVLEQGRVPWRTLEAELPAWKRRRRS